LLWPVSSFLFLFFFSSRRRHTRFSRDWSSDVCSSDLPVAALFDASSAPIKIRPLPADTWDTRPGRRKAKTELTVFLGRGVLPVRSEERRVGKECRARWTTCHEKKKRA